MEDIVNLMINKGEAGKLSWIFEKACRAGKLEMVKMISKNSENLNHGMACACAHGHLEIVKFLVSVGADDLNIGFKSACGQANLEIIEFLTSKGINTGTLNSELLLASSWGHTELMKLLISKGANNFNKALRCACRETNLEAVKLLISKGANDWNGALTEITEMRRDSLEIVKLMLINGGDIANLKLVEDTTRHHRHLSKEDMYYLVNSKVNFSERGEEYPMYPLYARMIVSWKEHTIKLLLKYCNVTDITEIIMNY